ncbi:hypothetical protein WJX73_007852 [Symbiochloris irregularis]|uniref:Uncharacterized protein n=1 Tax=Symbiochloris irregularis TaxID=706552 RepID=A0AAW1NQJ2_9CHLO
MPVDYYDGEGPRLYNTDADVFSEMLGKRSAVADLGKLEQRFVRRVGSSAAYGGPSRYGPVSFNFLLRHIREAYLLSIGYPADHPCTYAYCGHMGWNSNAAEEYGGLTIMPEGIETRLGCDFMRHFIPIGQSARDGIWLSADGTLHFSPWATIEGLGLHHSCYGLNLFFPQDAQTVEMGLTLPVVSWEGRLASSVWIRGRGGRPLAQQRSPCYYLGRLAEQHGLSPPIMHPDSEGPFPTTIRSSLGDFAKSALKRPPGWPLKRAMLSQADLAASEVPLARFRERLELEEPALAQARMEREMVVAEARAQREQRAREQAERKKAEKKRLDDEAKAQKQQREREKAEKKRLDNEAKAQKQQRKREKAEKKRLDNEAKAQKQQAEREKAEKKRLDDEAQKQQRERERVAAECESVLPPLSAMPSLPVLFTWWFTGMNDLGPIRQLPLDLRKGRTVRQTYSAMQKFFVPIQQKLDAGTPLSALIEQEEAEMSSLAEQTAAETDRKRKRVVSAYVNKKIGRRRSS